MTAIATRLIAAPRSSGSTIDRSKRGPVSAEPTGRPTMLRPIETAKARPKRPGSVRRWRIAKIATRQSEFAAPISNAIPNS